jgi:hypothetical protein
LAEIGSLQVNLTSNTAQFVDDLGKASDGLGNLKDKAGEAGEGLDKMGSHARGGLMLIEDAVGVRLPRHLNSLMVEAIPGVAAAFSAMLPLAGVAVAIKILGDLIEKHEKAIEAAHKLEEASQNAGIKGTLAMSNWGDKLLEAQVKADELAGDHIGALRGQLELLDHTTLKELVSSLESVTQEADTMFGSMLEGAKDFFDFFGSKTALIGGAKSAWDAYALGQKQMYADQIAAEHKLEAAKKANDPSAEKAAQQELDGIKQTAAQNTVDTLAAANKNLEAQLTVQKHSHDNLIQQVAAVKELDAAYQTLGGKSVSVTEASIAAQKQQIALIHRSTEDAKSSAVAEAQNAANLVTAEQQRKAREAEEQARKAKEASAEAARKLSEADKQVAATQKSMQSAIDANNASLIEQSHLKTQIGEAATKGGEDESPDKKLAAQKAAIQQQSEYDISVMQTTAQARTHTYELDVQAASLTAQEKAKLLIDYLKDVQTAANEEIKVQLTAQKAIVTADREATNERAALAKSLTQTGADGGLKQAIADAQAKEKIAMDHAKNLEALHQKTADQTVAAEIAASKTEVQDELTAYNQRIANLDKFDKDYLKKVEELQAKIAETEKRGADQQDQITQTSQQKQLQTVTQAQNAMATAIANDVTQSIFQNKSLGEALAKTGEQMAEGMMKNLLIAEMTGNQQKLIDAKGAAANAYHWASAWGGPPAGAVAGALAFASVMSFEVGGKIPGEGPVPITGHGGETVVTKALTDRVENSEKNGNSGMNGGGDVHMHYSPTVHAMDAEGVDRVLAKHGSTFERNARNMARKKNK